MKASEPLAFDEPAHRRIYEYVERNGAASPEEIWEAVQLDPERFNHEVAILRRDAYLRKDDDGRFRVALDGGTAEEFEESGVRYVVRPARQEDYSGVLGAIRSVATARTDIVAESVAGQLAHEEALVRHNRAECRMFFVATVDDDVVGWAHVQVPRVEKLRHTAELTVGVLEEYRRHGIGSHLLQRGLSWASSNDLLKVYNSLPSTNPEGISFLLEHGWTVEAVRTDHYRRDDGFVDEVMLAYAR